VDSQPTSEDARTARLRAVEGALRKVQAQAAALEELSEQLSLAVHVLEAEAAALGEELRTAERPGGRVQTSPAARPEHAARSADVDGARLVALDMALGGESREATGRYLEEHFDIPERERLLDEVYAAAGR
jgi:nitrogenase molybdenum-iron protein alpha/beta subunit